MSVSRPCSSRGRGCPDGGWPPRRRRPPVDERHRGEVLELVVADQRLVLLPPYCSEAMRIVSLVPSATETLFALGLGAQVTAVTHECDYPAGALNLPKVTRDVIGPGLAPDEIDRAVRELTEQGRSIYELDERGPARAGARPDRHPGAVQRLRGLRRRRARDRRAHGPGAGDRLARPAHARRGARRRPHARPGDRHQGRGRRPRAGRRRAHRPRPAGRHATPRASGSRCSSGSTRSSSAATGCRS